MLGLKNLTSFLLVLCFVGCGLVLHAQETYRDNFGSASYSNNDGTQNFGSNWSETNDDNSPTSGRIEITGGELEFNNLDNRRIERSLDLSAATSVVLTLDYDGSSRGNESLLVQLWNDNTSSFETVSTINSNTSSGNISHSLTADQISANSAIRFRGGDSNWGGSETILVDNIQFSATIAAPNDPPVVTATGDQTYCIGTSQPIVETISITDTDDTTTSSVFIQISNGYVNGEDLLTLTGTHPNITSSWDAVQGELSLTGPALYTEFEAAIQDVEFSSSSSSPAGIRQFSITVGEANYLPSTGHYYQYIPSLGITWTAARDAAALSTYYGLQGYLATLTTQDEADFSGSQASGVGWIGGSDAVTEGVWLWVTGPEAGTNFWNGTAGGSTPNFAFWNTNEPNQSGDEDYAHITHPNVNPNGSWNDLSNTGASSGNYQPQGYVVEYGGMPGDPVLNITAITTLNMDTEDPTASNPSPVSVSCSADVPAPDISVVTDEADNCTTNPTVAFVSDVSDGGSNPEIITRTYSVTDEAGNSINVTQTITINDTTPPVFSSCPTDIVLTNDVGVCGAVASWTLPVATDNCGGVVLTSNNYSSGDSFLPGVTTVVYTATDTAGNTATCSFTVTVSDTELPVVTGPSDTTVSTDTGSCEAVVNYVLPTVTDNCSAGDGTYPVTTDFEVPSRDDLIDECWQFAGTTVSTNGALNGSSSMRTSNLISTESRRLISPLTYFNGTGQITFLHKIDQVRNNNRITVSLVDESNNTTIVFNEIYSSTAVQSEAIDVTLSGNYRVQIDFDTNTNTTDRGRLDNLVLPGLKVADTSGSGACPAASLVLTQTAGLSSGASFPIGTTTNTFEATDAFGNVGTYSFDVTVEDNEDPTASNPVALTVYCSSDIPTPNGNVVTDEADNCTANPTVSFVGDLSDGGSNPEIITRTYSVSDAAGNSINVTQTINVFDIVIDTEPTGQNVFVSDNANFSVSTTNADTYQWQVSTNGGGTFSDITNGSEYAGVTTNTLNVLDVELEKNGYLYRVLVSNSSGSCPQITSTSALLSVRLRTVITNRRITYRVNKS